MSGPVGAVKQFKNTCLVLDKLTIGDSYKADYIIITIIILIILIAMHFPFYNMLGFLEMYLSTKPGSSFRSPTQHVVPFKVLYVYCGKRVI